MHPLAIVVLSAFIRTDATLDGGGGFVVKINEQGVLTGVPAKGVHPDLGPRILIAGGFHEWWGVDFMLTRRRSYGTAEAPRPLGCVPKEVVLVTLGGRLDCVIHERRRLGTGTTPML